MAGTGLDEHHAPLHDLTVGTLELHRKGGGSVGGTAAPICAHSAELSPVGLHTGAARKLEFDGLGDFGGTDALFALLRKTREKRKNNDYKRSGFFRPLWVLSLSCLTYVYILRRGSLSLICQFSKNRHSLSWDLLN